MGATKTHGIMKFRGSLKPKEGRGEVVIRHMKHKKGVYVAIKGHLSYHQV